MHVEYIEFNHQFLRIGAGIDFDFDIGIVFQFGDWKGV
jgi:hypothetical protein